MKHFLKPLLLFFSFYLQWGTNMLFAEGTKQLRPQEADKGSIQLQAQNGSGSTFAYSGNTLAYQRLNIRICNVGEVVYLGFAQKNNLTLRVFAPDGTLALGPVTLTAGVQGVINTYQQAVAGPAALPSVGAAGYDALSFVPTMTGDYYIEFVNSTPTTNNSSIIDLMDVTVTDATGIIKNGRLWSSAWLLNTTAGGEAFNGEMYVYTDDKITTLVNFNGIQPFEFVISANGTGTGATGNTANDRKSVKGNKTLPNFKIFLNEPDTLCFETGFIGEVLGEPSITGCPGNYCINVNVTAPGNMIFTIEGNNVAGFQPNTKDRIIQSVLKVGINCIQWDGLDGLGAIVGKNTPVSLSIQYINGLTNLPMYDVENHPNGYRVSYVRPKPTTLGTDVTLFWDDSNITGSGSGTIKPGETLVNAIVGCDYTPAKKGCHGWTNRGDQNICVSSACSETINTWWYIKESSKSLVYNFVEKKIDANITTPGSGSANDTSVCASTKEIILKGGLIGDSTSKWTKVPGKSFGTFEKPDSLRTKYTFSSADANLSQLVLVLSTANPNCPNIHDTIKINLEPLPKLTMPAPFQICSNNTTINTSASILNVGGIAWTSGDGKFLDSLKTAIQYTPSQKEIDSSYVKFFATTLPKAGQLCPMIKDSVKISVYLPATLQVPADTIVCQPSTSINLTLKANSINSDSVVWRSNGVIPVPKKGLTSSFALTNGNAFSVFLTAYKKGCNPIKDTVTVKFEAQPVITASQTDTCSPDLRVKLSGTSSLGSVKGTATWTSSGTGQFLVNKDTLTNAYIPSKLDSTAGQVSLKLSSKGQVFCPAKDTSFVYKIVPLPKASAGIDTLVCVGSSISRKTLANANWTYEWRTSASGSIVNSSPIFTFVASQDTSTFLVVKNSRLCVATDNSVVSIEQKPTISATPTFTCLPNLQVDLVGTASVTGSGIWSSSGNGNFGSSTTVLSPNMYIPSELDSTKGDVTLKLTSVGQTVCPAKDTSFLWKIIPLPKASAGIDTAVCVGSGISKKTIANADWTYEWRTSASGSVVNTNPIFTFVANQDSNTFLTVRNSRLCVATDNSIVSVEQKPSISATPTFTCLPNLQVDLVGTASVTGAGIWSSSGNGNFGSNATVLSPNSYIPSKQDSAKGEVTLKLTSVGQVVCTAAETTFLYKIIPLPKASAGNDNLVCINSSINLTSAQNTDWKYEWKSIKSGTILSATNKLSFAANLDTNRVYLKVLNSRNCEVSDSSFIATITPPTITLQPDFCLYSAQNILATVTNAPAAGVYDWKLNNNSLGISNTSLPISVAGNYSYHFNFNNGCKSGDTLQAFEPPKLIIADTSACLNGKTTLIANLIPNANYFWGTPAVNNGTNKFEITLTAPIPNFKVLVVDQNNCQASDDVRLDISPSPIFSLTGLDLCNGESKKLTATLDPLSNSPLSHLWTRNGITIPTTKWEELDYNQGGNYALTLGIKGCFETNTKVISVKPNPKITMPLVYKHCFETDPPLSLNAEVFKKYTWLSDGNVLDTTQNIKVAPEKDTDYFLKVENSFGCKDSTKLLVRKVCAPRVFVPNVITPESDDINAKLKIFGANYTNFEISIFNRWGEVIFNSKDPNDAWTGEYLNDKMPIGNYQWQVKYEGDTEEYKGPYKKTGDVAIIR